jgi:hypothetical protein
MLVLMKGVFGNITWQNSCVILQMESDRIFQMGYPVN